MAGYPRPLDDRADERDAHSGAPSLRCNPHRVQARIKLMLVMGRSYHQPHINAVVGSDERRGVRSFEPSTPLNRCRGRLLIGSEPERVR
jgi:hypothetical protein